MRQLATVQKITKLTPIEGADKIELARVLGWNVVVEKGAFKEGDLCVYCEIDSIMPDDNPIFDFLKDSKGNMKRIRTVKLRGQVSQGICFPLSILINVKEIDSNTLESTFIYPINEGEDVTEYLGIKKYEPEIPAHLRGKIKCTRPNWLPKTDETRVQVLGELIDTYQGYEFYITEKLDGTSMSVAWKDEQLYVSSRNMVYEEDDENAYSLMAKKLGLKNIFGYLPSEGIKLSSGKFFLHTIKNFVIQGELCGPGIQKNVYKLKDLTWFVFQVYDVDNDAYLDYKDMLFVCHHLLLPTVPLIEGSHILKEDVDGLVKLSVGKSFLNENAMREGIILRPIKEITISDNERISKRLYRNRLSFKCINPEYLLKNS